MVQTFTQDRNKTKSFEDFSLKTETLANQIHYCTILIYK